MQLLIDGDILLHRFAFANQYSIDWDGDGDFTVVKNAERAKLELDETVQSLMKSTKTKFYVFCISSIFNFRYRVLPTYKHNRSGEKPELYDILLKHALESYNTMTYKNLEADDLMGILSTEEPEEWVVATLDKDLDQIPGWHYNWNKDSLYRVDQPYCDYWFMRQVLIGDPTDGYKGCPGIGPKKADKLIGSMLDDEEPLPLKDAWQVVLDTYASKQLTEEDALQQARVARILRHGEYSKATAQPKLWSPNLL